MLLQACGGSSALLGGLLGGALRNWGAAALASRAGAQLYSSLPDLQEAPSFSSAPFVQLHPSYLDSPVLLRLRERPWGAQAKLTAAEVRSVIGNEVTAPNVGVLRDAFLSFDEPQRPLSQLLQRVRSGGVALATDVSNDPARRVVVDDYYYDAPTGQYVLRHTSVDLLSYLRQNNTHVALVPDVTAPGLANSTPVKGLLKSIWQSTNEVAMVAPTAFGFNEQAAQDNSFMHTAAKPGEGSTLTRQVLAEFAALHHQLTEVAGVKVSLFQHSLSHGTPDACFPNNWFSTHRAGEALGGVQKGTLVLYPMKCPNRAAERRGDIISVLQQRGYVETDMSGMEKQKKYFEGTGVLVLDRINGVAYVDISERADESLARQWVDSLGYKDLVTFRSTDLRGKSVYHTNVMMAVGTGVAIVCAESVRDAKERNNLLSKLHATHEVVEISLAQMDALCGNALEVQNRNGVPVMAMSTQAYNAFTADQRRAILRHVADIVHAPIDTLERVGGGGVRCTLAELF